MRTQGMLGLGKIGSIILAAVVVGVVLSVFYPPLIKEFKEIGAYVASGGKANLTGFKPYDPALRLSAEEHRTDDSMKALQCAIESAARGRKGWTAEGGEACSKDYVSLAALVSGEQITSPCSKEGIAYGSTCVDCSGEGRSFACRVGNFSLPQSQDDFDYGGWENFMVKAGDPKFIAYYEAFPAGEEAAWQADAMGISTYWIIASGVINAGLGMFFQVKAAGKIASESVERATETAAIAAGKDAGKEAASEVASKGGSRFFSFLRYFTGASGRAESTALKKTLLGLAFESGTENEVKLFAKGALDADEVLRIAATAPDVEAAEAAVEELARRAGPNAARAIDDLARASLPQADNAALLEESMLLARSIGREAYYLSRLSTRQLKALNSYRSLVQNLVHDGSIDETLLRSIFLDSAAKLPKGKALTDAIAEFQRYHPSVFLDQELYLLPRTLSGKELTYAQMVELEGALQDATIAQMQQHMAALGRDAGENIYRGILKNLFGTDEGLHEIVSARFIRSQIPTQGAKIGFAGGVVTFIPGGALGGAALGAATEFSLKHRYLVAFLLWLYTSQIDSMDEKFYPVGRDTLMVSTPNFYGERKPYSLTGTLSPFFISLEKDNQASSRFFLASPCQSDLTVTTTLCSCDVPSGSTILETQAGLQQVQPWSVESSASHAFYYWDTLMDDQQRQKLVDECADSSCLDTILLHEELYLELVDALYGMVVGARSYLAANPTQSIVTFQGMPVEDMATVLGPWFEDDTIDYMLLSKLYDAVYLLEQQEPDTIEYDFYRGFFDAKEGDFNREDFRKVFMALRTNNPLHNGRFFSNVMAILNSQYRTGAAGWSGIRERNKYDSLFLKAGEGEQPSLFWKAGRETAYHLTYLSGEETDTTLAVKECYETGHEDPAALTLAALRSKATLLHTERAITPCITVESAVPQLSGTKNYCYSSTSWARSIGRIALLAAFVAADAYITVATGGASQLLWLGGTGAIYAWIDALTAHRWPSHK